MFSTHRENIYIDIVHVIFDKFSAVLRIVNLNLFYINATSVEPRELMDLLSISLLLKCASFLCLYVKMGVIRPLPKEGVISVKSHLVLFVSSSFHHISFCHITQKVTN